jgi:predicted transcriptional regulator
MENEGIVYRGNQLRIGGVLWSIKKTKTKNEIVFDVLEKYGTMKKTAISAMCGISKRNIEEILKNLYSTGLISIEKKLQNGRTINFYSIKNKLVEIQFPQEMPEHPLSYLFKGSPWQGAENFMCADPNK